MADGDTQIENTTISGNNARDRRRRPLPRRGRRAAARERDHLAELGPVGGGIGVVESDFVPEVPPKPNTAVILRNTIIGGSLDGGSCDWYVASEGGNLDGAADDLLRSACSR